MIIGNEYWFLFALAGVVSFFASIEDIRKTEVANLTNYSFIVIAIVYRAFYSNFSGDWNFLIYGLTGFGVMLLLANLFYYTRVFAGADAKMLMGFGAVLPYTGLRSVFVLCFLFILALFFLGAIYSLIYSFGIALRNRKKFLKLFKQRLKIFKKLNQGFVIGLFGVLFLIIVFIGELFGFLLMLFIALAYFGQAFLISIDKLMIVKRHPRDLIEGDWLENDVLVGKRTIRKSVHGLSSKEINFLKKSNKSVLIKRGIPFIPVFFLTWIFMVYAFLTLQFPLYLF